MSSGSWHLACYDRAGKPVSFEEFALLGADSDYRVLQQEDVLTGDGRTMWVSTVWLGIDHGHGMSDEPLIFETMVFVDGMGGEYCQRYSTAQDALDGHADVLTQLHAGARVGELGMTHRR